MHPVEAPKNSQPNFRSSPNLASSEEVAELRRRFKAAELDLWEEQVGEQGDEGQPSRIARFEVQEELGRGSYGVVYVAFDPKLLRNVAIKVAHPGKILDGSGRSKFFFEAHAAARLGHPNIVTVHEYGEDLGRLYIVYELCVGPTLAQWLADRPDRIEPRVACEIIRHVAQGLSHAHARGIVHRDIKPGNIVMQTAENASLLPPDCPIDRVPRITDFGLAVDHDRHDQLASDEGLQGTIDYMSPEHVQGDRASHAATSDIYALGVLLYRMLAGSLPSRGSNSLDVLRQICSVEPPSPRYLNRDVPLDLAAVCMKCLAKKPQDRYQTCEQLIADLGNWKSGLQVSPRPRSVIEDTYHRAIHAPVVFSLALAVVCISMTSAVFLARGVVELRRANAEQAQILASERAIQAKAVQLLAENEKSRQDLIERSYRASMRSAYSDCAEGRLVSAAETLDGVLKLSGDKQQPRFDYHLLKSYLADAPEHWTPHSRTANDVLAIPGTRLVVSCGNDGDVNFHNVDNGKVVKTFRNVDNGDYWTPVALAVDPQGKRLAISWSFNLPLLPRTSMAFVYDLDIASGSFLSAEPIHKLTTGSTVQSLEFSPDGECLALGTRYSHVNLDRLGNGPMLTVNAPGRNRTIKFSPDSQRILVVVEGRDGPESKDLKILDAKTFKPLATIECESPQVFDWSPTGKHIAVVENNSHTVLIYCNPEVSAEPNESPMPIQATQDAGVVECIRFTPNGQRLVAGTRSGSLVVWDLNDSVRSQSIRPSGQTTPHLAVITALDILGDQNDSNPDTRVFSTDEAGSVIHSVLPLPQVAGRRFEQAVIKKSLKRSLSRKDEVLAGFPDGGVHRLSAHGKELEIVVPACSSEITAMAVSVDGNLAAVGWRDGFLAVAERNQSGTFDVRQCGYPHVEGTNGESAINSIEFSHDSKYLVACGNDNWARLWSTAELNRPLWEREHTSDANCVCFIGDSYVACGGVFEEIVVYDLQTGAPETHLCATSRANVMLYDPRHNRLASGHADGRIRVHDGTSWQLLNTLAASVSDVTSLVPSPCKDFMLAGDKSGDLSVWEIDTCQLVGKLKCFSQPIEIHSIEMENDLVRVLATSGQWRELTLSSSFVDGDLREPMPVW